jgi:excinuclease UvrABC nuclease subunit
MCFIILIKAKIETSTVTFKKITLDWIRSDYTNFPDRPGIYQIYGSSPLYGIDTLLYIGQARNLRNRIKNHLGDKKM